jgi:hypothetical protein
MSDKSEGPGWWIASDGKWYPPELHPSVREKSAVTASAVATAPRRRQPQSEPAAHVGPQFPDLFQKAMEGSHLADNVSVKYDGDDQRNLAGSVSSTTPAGGTGGGSTTKRRWRKSR